MISLASTLTNTAKQKSSVRKDLLYARLFGFFFIIIPELPMILLYLDTTAFKRKHSLNIQVNLAYIQKLGPGTMLTLSRVIDIIFYTNVN